MSRRGVEGNGSPADQERGGGGGGGGEERDFDSDFDISPSSLEIAPVRSEPLSLPFIGGREPLSPPLSWTSTRSTTPPPDTPKDGLSNLDIQIPSAHSGATFRPDSLHSSPLPGGLLEMTKERDASVASTAAWDRLDDDSIYSIDADDCENEAVHVGGELSISDIDEKYNRRLAKARVISYVGFLISIVQGSLSLGFGISHEVISLTAMGAQILIDLLSSMMVIWRFYTRAGGVRRNPRHADQDTRLKEALREKRAALGVGVLLTATSIWAASWAFVKVFGVPPPHTERVERARVTLSVAWPGFFLCTMISVLKWNFSLKLRSRVLQKDAVCSTFGAALSFITALFATIDYCVSGTESNTGAADSVAALIMAALLMLEGFRTVYQNTVGWVPPSGVTKETVDNYYQSRRLGLQH